MNLYVVSSKIPTGLWDHTWVRPAHLVRNVLLHAVRSHKRVGIQRILPHGVKEQMGEVLWIDMIRGVAVDERGEWLRILLDCGVDPGMKYSDSWTIWSRAAGAGCVNVVQTLVARNDI